MSNIPAARQTLLDILARPRMTKRGMRMLIAAALSDMTRARTVTRARKNNSVKITQYMRRMIRIYAKQGLSQTVIARKVGLPNAGRVSEVLHRKR